MISWGNYTIVEWSLGTNGDRQNSTRLEPTTIDQCLPVAVNHSASSTSTSSTPLPAWDQVLSAAELYLLYCDSQPLPLFHRESFLSTLESRDPEVIYGMMALSIRFSDDLYRDTNELIKLVNNYAEVARNLVMKRISEGPVELSTLQCLCLLSLVDFTSMSAYSIPWFMLIGRLQYSSLQHPQQSSDESSSMR